MNEILKKRIEEAELAFADKEYEVGEIDHDALCKGFFHGAEYALSHQFIKVEEALPDYEEDVIVTFGDDEYSLCHRSKNPNVLTDNNGFCNYGYKEVLAWMYIPKFNGKEDNK